MTDSMEAKTPPRLLIVSNPDVYHIGAHLRHAAETLGLPVSLADMRQSYAKPRWLQSVWWRWDRQPLRLGPFSRDVLATCQREHPTHLIATGNAPLRATELQAIRRLGVITMVYLTDDPLSPTHRSRWFLQSLLAYDFVFSPRRQNLDDLRRHGCRLVHYLPFAYAPEVHFPQPVPAVGGEAGEILFVGGADSDRLPYLRALTAAGLKVALYGSSWEKYAEFRHLARGFADLAMQRRITPAAGVVLCLVRRSNRDGHSMRSFEAPALGGCLLVEDTPEHREIFGPDGAAVVYFQTLEQMVDRARRLLSQPAERLRLAAAAHARITGGGNTYADRLRSMLQTSAATLPSPPQT